MQVRSACTLECQNYTGTCEGTLQPLGKSLAAAGLSQSTSTPPECRTPAERRSIEGFLKFEWHLEVQELSYGPLLWTPLTLVGSVL